MSASMHKRVRAGFTLIELMVALVAGSFVISGAYYLSDVSARLFNEQIRRAETQMTLRTAGEQLRRESAFVCVGFDDRAVVATDEESSIREIEKGASNLGFHGRARPLAC